MAFGSNLGDRLKNIKSALAAIRADSHIKVLKASWIIETKPQGGPRQGDYLNGVAKIKTSLAPIALLRVLKHIEKSMGRKKGVRFGPRIIDLDILLYGDKIIHSKRLIVPHPRMRQREFVMGPLREIEPNIDTFLDKLASNNGCNRKYRVGPQKRCRRQKKR